MDNWFSRRGGLWVVGQFALLIAVAALGFVVPQQPRHPLLLPFSLLSLAASLVCGVAGLAALGRNLTPFPKPPAKSRLVQHGIYRLVRHPLYLSVICGAIGWSLIRQSWPALAVSLVLALYLDAKARREERWLREQFPDYADYQRRVRRFVPWVY